MSKSPSDGMLFLYGIFAFLALIGVLRLWQVNDPSSYQEMRPYCDIQPLACGDK